MSTTAKDSTPNDQPATATASSAWSRGPPSGSKPSSNIPTPVLTPQPQAEASQAEASRNAPLNSGNGSAPVAIGSHSRKGSIMVGGGADIKKGSIAFGTVDLDNAGLSSSPAAPSVTGTHLADTVKSFGSIDADSTTDSTAVKAPKQFDMHASFTGKPKQPAAAPSSNPNDRRQSTGGGFQQQPGPNGGPANPHLRPPQQGGAPGQPRSPVLGQAGVNHYNPNQPQIQHGFRAPQAAPGAQGFVRANGSGPQPGMQPGMQRGMGMGAYGMHPGPQGQYPVMNHPYQQQPFFEGYGYPQQQFGMPQWAPHQHPQNQQYNMPPISPRPGPAQPNAAAPSPAPQPAQLPVSRGASPVPTPPSRPGSLIGHQPTPSNVSISSIPSTPSRPMIPTTASFTPPTQGQPGFNLSGTAAAFTPTRASRAIKLTRPDGTAVDLKAVAAANKGPTPGSSGVATPEPVEEAPKKKVPSLPVMVRLESEAQKEARLAEEARQAHIKELEAKEEEERKARKARQEAEKKEREEKEQKEREEKERKEQEQKEKDEEAKEKEAAQAASTDATSDVKEKVEEKVRTSTPGPSTPGSPLASPALGAAGLPAKPVASAIPRRPVPAALDLKSSPAPSDDQNAPSTSSPSALSTARPIEDLSAIVYPGTLKSPKPELNTDAQPGKFRYDRDFLMQFMGVCKDKPDSLPPLEEIGLEADSSSGFGSSRGARGSRPSMGSGRGGTPAGLGIANIGRPSFPGQGMGSFGMGQFGSTGSLRGTTSEERYNRSRQGNMSRTPSQAGMHGLPSMGLSTSRSGTNRSRGGTKRTPQATQLDPDVTPLVVSSNSWVKSRPTTDDEGSPAFIERKVKALLNKLTAEKFDVISKQILDWANKSAHETDGMTLKLVIKQIFEKATDEAHWSSMYARLCRMLLEQLDPAITENFDGKPVSGGLLFRRYLVGRCQVDFENGWKARELAATAAAAKSEEDRERLAQHEKDQEGGESTGEAAMLSDEYYAAQKAKRRGLGLVQLIGELYKLDMLGKGVIRTCFIKLLGNVENPDEEDLESSCKLLATVGKQFEAASPENMEIVFDRLNNVVNSENVSSRIRFMILDMIDLRKAGWKSKNQATGVMTIAEIHQQAAKEQAERSAAAAQVTRESISRGGSRAGSRRDAQPGEWQSVAPNARPVPRADFSGLGRGVSSAGSSAPNFGPNSVFNRQKGKPPGTTTPPLSRQASTSNMFSALDAMESPAGERRTSTDAGEPQRKKLNLQPRTKPIPGGEEGEEDEEDESAAPAESEELTEEAAKSKIDTDMKELWGEKDAGGSRNPEDISEYFNALPEEFKPILAQRLADDVFRISKVKDAEIVAKGWAQSLQAGTVSKDVLVKGLASRMPTLDDDAIDFPQAYKAVALIARAVSLSADEIDDLAKKIDVYGEPKITPQMKLERALTAVDEERAQ